jgi:hypothetical protein
LFAVNAYMIEFPERENTLAVHIRAAARPQAEAELVTAQLLKLCWPGGVCDHDEPSARGWLRLWGPGKVVLAVPVCRCHEGRCAICN